MIQKKLEKGIMAIIGQPFDTLIEWLKANDKKHSKKITTIQLLTKDEDTGQKYEILIIIKKTS